MTLVVIALAIGFVALLVLVLGLLRSHGEILRALHDLGVNLDEADSSQLFRAANVPPASVRDTTAGLSATPDVALSWDGETSMEADITQSAGIVGSSGILEAQRPGMDAASLGGARDIAGMTPDGEAIAIGVIDADQPTLLAFLSSGCAACQEFWDEFSDGVALQFGGQDVRIVAVTKSEDAESPGTIVELARNGLTTVMSTDAYEDYGVPVSPYFVMVAAESSIILGEGSAVSWMQLASLLDRAIADRGVSMGPSRSRRDFLSGAARHRHVDQVLAEAGIGPDHPSLRPQGSGDQG